jgi:hypothetical protein
MDSQAFKQKVAYWLERHQYYVMISDGSRGLRLIDIIAVTPYPGFVRIFTAPSFFNDYIKHPMTEMPKDSHAFPRVIMVRCENFDQNRGPALIGEAQATVAAAAKLIGCEAAWATCNEKDEMRIRWIHPLEQKELTID